MPHFFGLISRQNTPATQTRYSLLTTQNASFQFQFEEIESSKNVVLALFKNLVEVASYAKTNNIPTGICAPSIKKTFNIECEDDLMEKLIKEVPVAGNNSQAPAPSVSNVANGPARIDRPAPARHNTLEERTVKEHLAFAGFTQTPEINRGVGRIVATSYRQMYGTAPKTSVFVDSAGNVHPGGYLYEAKDWQLIENAHGTYMDTVAQARNNARRGNRRVNNAPRRERGPIDNLFNRNN